MHAMCAIHVCSTREVKSTSGEENSLKNPSRMAVFLQCEMWEIVNIRIIFNFSRIDFATLKFPGRCEVSLEFHYCIFGFIFSEKPTRGPLEQAHSIHAWLTRRLQNCVCERARLMTCCVIELNFQRVKHEFTIDGSCYANYAIKSPSISSQMHVNYVLYVLLHWLLRSFDGNFATSKVECNILETCVCAAQARIIKGGKQRWVRFCVLPVSSSRLISLTLRERWVSEMCVIEDEHER